MVNRGGMKMRGTVLAITGKYVYPLMALLSMIGFSTASQGAAYIKYEGIDGESKDQAHEGWIDVLSVDYGIIKPGGTPNRESPEGLSVEMVIDSASVPLFNNALNNTTYGTVEIDLCEGTPASICDPTQVGDQHCYLKYTLKNVLVTSYETNDSGNDEAGTRGTVKVRLKFEKLNQEYTPAPLVCPPQ